MPVNIDSSRKFCQFTAASRNDFTPVGTTISPLRRTTKVLTMADAQNSKGLMAGGLSSGLLESLASDALERVASKLPTSDLPFDQDWVVLLSQSVCDPHPRRAQAVVKDMLSRGFPALTIANDYCTEAARYLGEGWCDDTSTFGQVSIGTSRLQSLVRELYEIAASPHKSKDRSIAVIVRPNEQ